MKRLQKSAASNTQVYRRARPRRWRRRITARAQLSALGPKRAPPSQPTRRCGCWQAGPALTRASPSSGRAGDQRRQVGPARAGRCRPTSRLNAHRQFAPPDSARQGDWAHPEPCRCGAEVARLADRNEPERGLLDVGQGRRGVHLYPCVIGRQEACAPLGEALTGL